MRIGLGLGLGVGGSPWNPTRSPLVRHWYDPKRGLTLNVADVSAWADQGSGAKSVVQATDAQQPAYVAAGGVFGNLPHIAFTGANNDELQATSAADWKFLHDGTGMFVAMRFRPTAAGMLSLVNTLGLSSGSVGVALVWDSTSSGYCQMFISNGDGGGYEANIQTLNGSAPINTAHTVIAWFQDGASQEVGIEVDGGTPVTASFTATPAAGNPDYPLTIGSRPNAAANDLTGEIADVVIGTGAPDATLRAHLRTFLGRTS